jgi:hypothetical protein
MTKAEVAVIILGLTLTGAAIWIPSLPDRTRALLLLLVMAAGILLILHRAAALLHADGECSLVLRRLRQPGRPVVLRSLNTQSAKAPMTVS